jgi:hypothetical protein
MATYLIINVVATAYTIIHMTQRWNHLIPYLMSYQIERYGFKYIGEPRKKQSWDDIYFLASQKWFNSKIDILNATIAGAVVTAKSNVDQAVFEVEAYDEQMKVEDLIVKPLQLIHVNIVFLIHVLFLVVCNAIILMDLSNQGLINIGIKISHFSDSLYATLQSMTTIGFGEIFPRDFWSRYYYVILYLQVLITIILGLAFRNSAAEFITYILDKMSEVFNKKMKNHKNECLKVIKFRAMSNELQSDINGINDEWSCSSFSILAVLLKEYMEDEAPGK